MGLEPNGSELCLACGLCCQGVLHSYAVIKQREMEHVRMLGLRVAPLGDNLGFHLPCPLYRDNRCSIYAESRPRACESFRCRLLNSYLVGTISLRQALEVVRRACELSSKLLAQGSPACSVEQLSLEKERARDLVSGVFSSPESR